MIRKTLLRWMVSLAIVVIGVSVYASPVLYFEGVLTNQGPVSGNTSAFLDSVYTVHIAIKADVNLSQVRVNSTSGTELWSETFPYRFDNGHIYVELG
ncbi:hypothetical protein EB093_08140, partial [bacterium]|nr:hypothetical protein [bacterium]